MGFQDLVADAKKKITEISPTDAAAKAKSSSDVVIVDVREKDEFDENHIPQDFSSEQVREADAEYKEIGAYTLTFLRSQLTRRRTK